MKMFEILTAEQSKQADAAAIASGIPGLTLMEAAGSAVVEAILKSFEPCPVLVLCGPGNNGGDGFVVAHHLARAGWAVRLACLVKRNALKNDAALAAKLWDGEVESLNSNLSIRDAGLVIDAVFGTGFTGDLPPEIVTLFDKVRAKKLPVVAIDLPSGLDATTARVAPGTPTAALTVTFTRKKPAHVLLPGKPVCGETFVAPIGIPDRTISALDVRLFENDPSLWLRDYPLPKIEHHKYDRGHAVIIAGKKRPGAACLAAGAAQKIGAGLTTIAAPPESTSVCAAYRASIMADAWDSIEDLKTILRDERKNVLVMGPGLGLDAKAVADTALSFNKGGVLDADIFSLYQDNPGELFTKISSRHILTPHEGEFERLFPHLEGSKPTRALTAAKTCNAIVLLKGADSVIASADGNAIINTNAPPTLATAGSGDVLAGLIAGLIAQGMTPFSAAAAATWLHAEAARIHGLCLTPEDIINSISQTVNCLF